MNNNVRFWYEGYLTSLMEEAKHCFINEIIKAFRK